MLYSFALVGAKRRVIRAIDINTEQSDPSGETSIQLGPLPACKEQTPVGHDERVHITGYVEGQAT